MTLDGCGLLLVGRCLSGPVMAFWVSEVSDSEGQSGRFRVFYPPGKEDEKLR